MPCLEGAENDLWVQETTGPQPTTGPVPTRAANHWTGD